MSIPIPAHRGGASEGLDRRRSTGSDDTGPTAGQARSVTPQLTPAELAARWPDVLSVPVGGVRAVVARRLFQQAVKRLPVRVLLTPDGADRADRAGRADRGGGADRGGRADRGGPADRGNRSAASRDVVIWGAGDRQSPTMHLLRPDDFFARVGAGGLIGFGEAFLAGDWVALADPADAYATTDGDATAADNAPGVVDVDASVSADADLDGRPDPLVALLTVLAADLPRMIPAVLQRLRRLAVHYQPKSEENTPGGSRSNISRHYDLSNDLFATFLDPTMSYSAAIFGPDRPTSTGGTAEPDRPARWDDLAAAQTRKIDRLLDACDVGVGTRVLEIGTGWGELAIRAAARGARVHSVTLSEEQLLLAKERVAAAGLSEAVTIELSDYRAVAGRYDAVLSVEMIEAVGDAYWPAYFATIDRVLAPGGSVGLQAITMPHDRMIASRRTYTWMHKYVFPGGLLPSVEAVHRTVAGTSLRVVDDFAFGLGYAETLRLWRERFVAHAPQVQRLGFDPIFLRMWTFYLAYCEAGFRSRYIDVHQFVLRRPEQLLLPGPEQEAS